MIYQSDLTHQQAATAQKRAAWLLTASCLLSFVTLFLNMYFLCLLRAIAKHSSYAWIKWPLPHYVTHEFLSSIGCGTAFLIVFVIILWAVTLNHLKHCPNHVPFQQNQ